MRPADSTTETAAGAMLAAALSYVETGLRVFPLKPCSKVPATLDGLKSATTDVEQVRAWWQRWPNANVAIRTGADSGVVVLDIDVQHGGAGSLGELERCHGELPKTARVLTGGGGQHVYFRHPGREIRNSAGKLGAGLDVRGDGGYVVAPPSVHENGRAYKWMRTLDRGIADVPAWLLEDAEKRRNGGPAEPVDEMIPEGRRREALLSLAGTLRRRGLGASEILAALEAVNAARCRPMLRPLELQALAHDVAGRWEPDPASVLPSDPDDPDNRTNSVNASSHAAPGCPGADRTTPGQPPELALEPAILDVFAADLRRRGVAGLLAPIALLVGRLVSNQLGRWSIRVGVAAAVVQVIGLLRWPLIVPFLADRQNTDTFETVHTTLGTVIGETFGYLLTATWTVLIIYAFAQRLAGPWFKYFGLLAAALIAVGVFVPLDVRGTDFANFAGYILWSVWLVIFAVLIWRRSYVGDPATPQLAT
jgi:Bifunctional DNA primase/polymerase, N-terminal/Domain of unknown function (DUF4386)/Primase C terminal 1 (PriCT-1)